MVIAQFRFAHGDGSNRYAHGKISSLTSYLITIKLALSWNLSHHLLPLVCSVNLISWETELRFKYRSSIANRRCNPTWASPCRFPGNHCGNM